jgi:cytochrome c556
MAVDGFQANSSTKEPPVEATPPKQTESKRQMSDASAADRVWNDPEYFKELEAKIFA